MAEQRLDVRLLVDRPDLDRPVVAAGVEGVGAPTKR